MAIHEFSANGIAKYFCRILVLLFFSGLAVLYLFGRYQWVASSLIINSEKHKSFQNTISSEYNNLTWQGKIVSSPYVNRHLKYNQTHVTKILNGYHKILWWNKPSWMKASEWNNHCNISLCEYSNCKLTTDKRDANISSAIIISIVDGGFPKKVSWLQKYHDQGLVFFSLETSLYWIHAFKEPEWHNVFNWSMTYRRDADIFIPYGWLGQRESQSDKNYSEIFRRKTKQVAWIVSHCSTDGKREEYIKQLQKYIKVDQYGGCSKNRLTNNARNELLPQYKFYLGFENAFCKDYITEKFFYYLKYDLVVVVRGLTDYNNLLPNNSFINTANFPSIESLGQYLVKLSNDETEYIRYLKEINRYKVLGVVDTYCDAICDLCEKVNNIDDNRRTYGNIFDWTGGCEKPKDLF